MMRKAFLLACASLFAGSMWAQQEPANGGVYYLYNAESGQFLSRGNNWGTRGVTIPVGTPWQVSVADGKYTLRMYDLVKDGSKSGLGSNCFADNGSPVAFTPEGDATSGYTLKTGDNYLTAPATAGNVEYTATASVWQFLSKEEYNALMATKAAVQEAAVAAQANLELDGSTLSAILGDVDNWASTHTVDATPTKSAWNVAGVPYRAGNQNNGDYGCEIYQGGGSFSKTITGLKPGIYKVKVKGLKRMVSNATCYAFGHDEGYVISDAYFTANGNTVQIADWASACTSNSAPNSTGAAKAIWDAGNGYVREVYCYVGEDGNLTMKAASEAYWGLSWFLFGGVEYTYYTNQVADEDAAALLASVPTGKMTNEVKSTLDDAVSVFESAKTIKNYNALQAAVTAATASAEAYASAGQAIPKLDAVFAATNVYTTEAWAEYSELKAGYEAGTLTTAEADKLKAANTYRAVNYYDDVLLSAWTVGGEQCHEYDKSLYINTWSTEADNKENGSGMKAPFFEYWTVDGNSLAATQLAANVTVPNGYYTLTTLVRVRIKNNDGDQGHGVTLDVNGVSKSVCLGETCDDGTQFRYGLYTVPVEVTAGALNIAFNVAEDNNISWLSYKDVKYNAITKAEFDELSLKSDEEIAALVATMPTGKMEAEVKAAMDAAKATLESTKKVTDYDALADVIATANISATAYAIVGNMLDRANAAVAKYDATAQAAYDVAAITEAYNNGALKNTECATKATEVYAAWTVAAKAATAFEADAEVTPLIVNNSFESDWSGWVNNQMDIQGNNSFGKDGNKYAEFWLPNGTMGVRQTLSSLPQGYYAVTVSAKARGLSSASVFANDNTTEMTIADEQNDYTANAIVVDKADLVFGATCTGTGAGASWFAIDNFRLTYVRALTVEEIEANRFANAEEIAAYNATIEAIESKFGFEAGEYAPYNNVESIAALAAAKVDVNVVKAVEVVAATTAIENITFDANTEAVNAIYNGDFALCDNDGAMPGWHMSTNTLGGSYHARAFVLTEGMTNYDNLATFNQGDKHSAAYLRFDGTNSGKNTVYTYGKTEGYTMPLTAGVTYRLDFDFGGWGQIQSTRFRVISTDGTTVLASTDKVPSGKINDGKEANHITLFVTPTTTGNHTFTISNPSNNDNAILISNITLVKAPIAEVAMTITDAQYATFIAPFAVEVPEGVTASTVEGTEDKVLVMSEVENGVIPANTPVVLYSENAVSQTFCGYNIATKDSYTTGLLTGTYSKITAPEGSYVLQNQNGKVGFYLVDYATASPAVNANRAYFTAPATAGVRLFFLFDDLATGINAAEAVNGNDAIYDLSGRRVNNAVKGIYIINGKKVLK